MPIMKRFVVLILVLCFGAITSVQGQGLDDEYVQIFRLIQEADTLSTSAPSQALAKYLDAQAALDRLHKGSPDWNPRIVNYRLTYVANRIAALSATTTPPTAPQGAEPKPQGATVAPRNQTTTPADWQAQLNGLKEQVRQAQSDKALLEAKLKEALALRPAEADPGELAKAEEKIKTLQKENDLLRVSRENPAPAPAVDVKALDQARQSLAEADRQLDDRNARLSKLTLEKEALETRLKNSSSESAAVADLRTENQLLKKKLAEVQVNLPASRQPQENTRQLTEAKNQIAMLQSDKESLRLEKLALENRIKQLTTTGAGNISSASAAVGGDNGRIKQLEGERDELQKRLDAATKELYGRKAKSAPGRVQDLENQLALVRARLEIFEARALPYSAEELALLKRPEPKLAVADPNAGKKSIKELPAGAATLVAEAQRSFAAKEYDKAESAYLQVLQLDQKNVPTLANLAMIQVKAEHFDKAEANIKQALSLDPEDAYSLYVLGILRFHQAKYDEALDALSHSAKLDPQNAEVQNFLGLTLSEKGMRVPAEAALRKAIQLQPSYADAHYNLAVVYATQQPPASELARWHYQKAIASGLPRNPDLEKRFEARQ
jgi:cytochrome c-type biogenesis protein CcmH/NrfG